MSQFPVPLVITRLASGTCLDHVLTKFSDKVVSFGVRFSRAMSDHCIFCLFLIVLNHFRRWIDYEFLRFHISLLDWVAIYAIHVVDEQVCLLTGFIGQLYDVCVSLRRRFDPDSRTPWMTVGRRDSIRGQDAMNSMAPGFRAVKCRVAALIKTAATRLAERRFDLALPPIVLWSNFRRMGFCDSSYFSSLGICPDGFFVICLPLRLLSCLIRSV
jgi:hypothetical protein